MCDGASPASVSIVWLQMPSVMELVGHGAWKYDEENPGVPDGGTRVAAMGAGHGIPSRWVKRKKCKDAGRMRLSLARRYNTLDLAGKVSVPRGCGPFGNPGGTPSLYALQFTRINFIHLITPRIDIGLVMTGQYNCFSLSLQSKKQFSHFFSAVVIQSIKRFI